MADIEMSSAGTAAEQTLAIGLQPLFTKLKPGPGLAPEQVFADQRRRLHAAMTELVHHDGWGGIRVRSLAQTAQVSTATFYRHFPNADACLASTHKALVAAKICRLSGQSSHPVWHESLRGTIAAFMLELALDPRSTRLMLVDIFAGGPTARKSIGPAVDELEGMLAASFAKAPTSVIPPRHLLAGMTAGMLRIARTTTLAGRVEELPDLAEEIGDWMVSLPDPAVLSLLAGTVEDPGRHRERCPFPGIAGPPGAEAVWSERERLLRAVFKLAATKGLSKVTASRLRAEAGVSRRTFDATFHSVEECLLESVEGELTDFAAGADGWSLSAADWRQRTCRFVLAICAQAARHRALARLAFLGSIAAGHTGLLWRERMIGRIAAEFRQTVPAAHHLSPIAAEASVAASWHIVQTDVAARRASDLPRVAPLLSYVILAPVVGSHSAASMIQAQ
jgi:AcrR family transcriptional regulator